MGFFLYIKNKKILFLILKMKKNLFSKISKTGPGEPANCSWPASWKTAMNSAMNSWPAPQKPARKGLAGSWGADFIISENKMFLFLVLKIRFFYFLFIKKTLSSTQVLVRTKSISNCI